MSTTTTQTPAAVVNTTPAAVDSKGVTTPPKAVKGAKAAVATQLKEGAAGATPLGLPAAKPSPSAIKSKVVKAGATVIAYEPGLATIKLSDLDTGVLNITRPEGTGEDKELKELATSIEVNGQQTAIIAQRVKGGKHPFRIAAGYRRVAAMLLLKRDSIEARIEASGTDEARILCNVTENENARKAISALGRLDGYEALLALGHPVAKVAEIVGHAEDFVRDTLRISQGAPCIREALGLTEGKEGAMAFGAAKYILRKGEAGRSLPVGAKVTEADLKEQTKLFGKCLGLSVEATRAFITSYYAPESTDGEGEGDGSAKGKADDKDPTYSEARVVKATMPFFVKYFDAMQAMDAAVKAMEAAVASMGVKIPPVTDALKAIDAASGLLVKGVNQQHTALVNLLDEKAFKAYLKEAQAAAKE